MIGKVTIFCVILFSFGLFKGCSFFSSVKSANTSIENKSTLKKINDTNNLKSDEPQALVSLVKLNNNKLSLDGILSRHHQNFQNESEAGKVIEVDIMNCAGFLGSARTKTTDKLFWELKFIDASIAADAVEKVKRCHTESYSDDKAISGSVFAVFPRKSTRQSIKIDKTPDIKKVIASLPIETRKWAEIDVESINETLLKNMQSDWTDLDGDGTIDLLALDGECAVKPEDSATCTKILYLTNGKWKEIGYISQQ